MPYENNMARKFVLPPGPQFRTSTRRCTGPVRVVTHQLLAKHAGVWGRCVLREIARRAKQGNPVSFVETTVERETGGRPTSISWLSQEQCLDLLRLWGRTLRIGGSGAKNNPRWEEEQVEKIIVAVWAADDLEQRSIAQNKARLADEKKLSESRAKVIELEARLELQNLHLKRHQEYTVEAEKLLKAEKELNGSVKILLEDARTTIRKQQAIIAEHDLSFQGHLDEREEQRRCIADLNVQLAELARDNAALRARLDGDSRTRPAIAVPPSGKWARPGWFSYRIAAKSENFNRWRHAHGLELLADLGVCDRRGVPTEAGKAYCRQDGFGGLTGTISYKWDMALVELMQRETP